ncbi:MAG: arginine deiminase-related protein [Pseudomonadota bacterium]
MSADRQCTDTVFVVRPCRFQANPETAASNAFQAQAPWQDLAASNARAQQQFDGLVDTLTAAGVRCLVFDDTPDPHTPDSIFPNNWITTHADGSVVLFPMEAPSRRGERRSDIVEAFSKTHGFEVARVVDLSPAEDEGRYLEGTGSLVLDRVNRVAYACRASRTNAQVLEAFASEMDYRPLLFDSVDADGQPIYHTNVMMWLGTKLAGVCLASLAEADRTRLLAALEASGHTVIDLSFVQLEAFAGNMLELVAEDGSPVIAMSQQAYDVLTDAQREQLEAHARLAVCPIDHIETQSGGSVRCMLAEVYLPHAQALQ